MHRHRIVIAAAACILLWPCVILAQIQAVSVGTGFTNPVFATSAPGSPNTLYVVQQGGLIRELNTSSSTIGTTLLDVGNVSGSNFISGGEQGLLGLAFHPNFENNRLMYVQYTYNNGQTGGAIRIEQYQVGANGQADASSRRTVIEFPHPDFTNHNAGWIGFNPQNGSTGSNSGQLYIMTGDGGSGNDPNNNSQNRNSLQGKILRVDVGNGLSVTNPNYAIPTGNMTGTSVRSELYAYGLRNPYRAGFDRQTGNLYIGDVGQNSREEVDFIANGTLNTTPDQGINFGWRLREGFIATPTGGVGGAPPVDNVNPIFEYDRGTGFGQSITGGYVYRGTTRDDSGLSLDGTYFFGDYITGRIFSIRYDGTNVTNFTERTAELGFSNGQINLSSFAEDGFGNLYAIAYGGTVFRIVPVPEPMWILASAALGLCVTRCMRRKRSAEPPHG